ncbi:MAG: hypothetical protein AB1791_13215 [Chloroflexota bacterium]
MNDGIVLDSKPEDIVGELVTALARRGFYVVRGFDLRSALAAYGGCPCPHHGTAQCSCQYVVLLVYGETAEPVTLTAHSCDGRTWAQIVHDATIMPDPHLVEQVTAVLGETSLLVSVAPEESLVAYAW